ncbi:exo-alpha-sialidase [Nonomuraea sp. NPDC050536]|uniref:exo-alpha-sialidase n=1 Tax=Nonomuraea sp. NPDC050536 TaxID=3364366 RepID=UPI0037CB2B8A
MTVFQAGTDGYHTFRIPALVLTRAGTLLAFAEGRHDSAGDSGHIDLVLKRSPDLGATWGPLEVVATEPAGGTAGNPAPVVTGDGRIVLVFVTNAATATEKRIRRGLDVRRVFVQDSADDGLSWSAAREITASVKDPAWGWYATTPGHAIQLSDARIVVPGNHSAPPDHHDGGHALLSDDGGATWRLGYVDDGPSHVNESTAAELADGRVYVNARSDSPLPGTRADAYSADGGQSLERPFLPQPDLVGPVVEGSVLAWDADLLLYSGPADPAARRVMTIRASRDAGQSWKPVHTVSQRPAAYSDLARLDDHTLGLLYETGERGPYEQIAFERIPLAELPV